MKLSRALLALGAAALLTACVQQNGAVVAEPVSQCVADRVQYAVGRSFSEGFAGRLQKRASARTVRVIHPSQAVTMDYRSDRLNIEVDASNKIKAARCG